MSATREGMAAATGSRARLAWGLAFALALGLTSFLLASGPLNNFDVWWHMAYARNLLRTGQLPSADPFSHTIPGATYDVFQWLSQLFLLLSYRLGGVATLVGLRVALIGATLALLWKSARVRGASQEFTALAVTLALLAIMPRSLVRPQLFHFLALAAAGLIRASWLGGRRGSRWWAVPLQVLWINLHAGLAAMGGLIVLATAAQDVLDGPRQERGRRLKEAGLLVGLVALASFASPLGWRFLAIAFAGASYDATVGQNHDWAPFSLDLFSVTRPVPYWAFAVLAVGTVFACWRSWRRRADGRPGASASDLVLFVVFLLLALRMRRAVASFAVVVAPLLAAQLTGLRWPPFAGLWRSRAPWLGRGLLLIFIALLPLASAKITATTPRFVARPRLIPGDGVAWIRAHQPQGQLFNPYHWGGYLIWALTPDYKVFIDGRDHPYQEAGISKLYFDMVADQGAFDAAVERFDLGVVIAENHGNTLGVGIQSALQRRLLKKDWALVFHGPSSTIYLRRSPGNEALIREREYHTILPRVDVEYVTLLRDPGRNGPVLRREIERLLAESPGFAEGHLLLGRYLEVWAKSPLAAQKEYLAALASEPYRADVYLLLSELAPRVGAVDWIDGAIDDAKQWFDGSAQDAIVDTLEAARARASTAKSR